MKIRVEANGRKLGTKEVPETESDVYGFIGKMLSKLKDSDIPGTMKVEEEGGNRHATFKLIKRGTVKHADGTSSPSLYVSEEEDELSIGLAKSAYEDAYLVCINPAGNNYKFYWLRPDNAVGVIGARYGRIGSTAGEMYGVRELFDPYPSRMFWIRYYEKLSKGYKDMTNIYLEKKKVTSKKPKEKQAEIDVSTASGELYDMLVKFARNVVNNVIADATIVTKTMVEKAKKLHSEMEEYSSANNGVDGFNSILVKLLMISPRKVLEVNEWLAKSSDDFEDILDREESLINAMEAVVSSDEEPKKSKTKANDLWGMDIDIHYPSAEEKQAVTDLIAPEMRREIRSVFMVRPQAQEQRFNAYLDKHKITKTESLFHGSGKENWYSITKNSLLLPQNNNARKTGQALGAGLYFGNHAKKSSHYTRDESTYILGIFDVAYGNPMKITDTDHHCYRKHNQTELDSKGCDCVHYTRIGADWADEIVVFNEDAACLKALVIMDRH